MLSTIRTILIADPAVSAIVGTNIFVAFAPQEVEAPYIILEELYKNPNDCKGQQSTVDSYGFAVTAVGLLYSTVEDVLGAVRKRLDGYSDEYYRGVSFAGIQDIYDGTQDYHVNSNSYKSLVNVL